MGQSALCPAKMKRCPAQSRTANAIDTTPAPRKDVAAPAARPKGPAAKKAVQKTPTSRSGGQRGTSTWWYKIPAHGERARCNFVLHNAILLARAAGDRHPSSFAAYLLMGLPTMADFRPGGSRRFGASLRSQYRSCGVWLPLSFYADAWPVVGCTAAGDIGSTDCLFTCQRHYITGIGRCQPSSLPQCHVQDHHYGKARGKGQRPRAGIAARGQQLGGHHIEHSPGGKAQQPGQCRNDERCR